MCKIVVEEKANECNIHREKRLIWTSFIYSAEVNLEILKSLVAKNM